MDLASPFSVLQGTAEILSGKSIRLTSERAFTNFHECSPSECPWKRVEHEWVLVEARNGPFKKWLAAKVILIVAFEYNGCDIANARCVLSPLSFVRWYADRTKYVI